MNTKKLKIFALTISIMCMHCCQVKEEDSDIPDELRYVENSRLYGTPSLKSEIEIYTNDMYTISIYIGLIPDYMIAVSSGKVKQEENLIICTDKISKREYRFEKIDSYRLGVKSRSIYFNLTDTLYLESINAVNSDEIETFRWENGKPNGVWLIFNEKGKKAIKYIDGNIESEEFETWEEIYSGPPGHEPPVISH